MPDPTREFQPPRLSAEASAHDTTPTLNKTPTLGEGSTKIDTSAPPGEVVLGPPGYDLLDMVGEGGMGSVYRARDQRLDRDVAVKLLHEKYNPTSLAARRFLDEARITAQLQHPGIPPVHEVGTLPDGRPFLAMKLIKGRTLAELLSKNTMSRGALLTAFEQVCQAVAYAHDHGVIHRDLKPSNIMVGAFGEIQVMDWGLAKVLPDASVCAPTDPDEENAPATEIRTPRTEEDATQAGTVMGTPAYMPPEQANGQIRLVGRQSDVFSLGGILCSILTGQPPYIGRPSEIRAKTELALTEDAFRRLEECGGEHDLVLLAKSCLARNPADRPADASQVAALMAEHHTGVEARLREAEQQRAAAVIQANEQRRRKQVIAIAASVVGLALAGAAGVSIWQTRIARNAEANAKDEATAARKAEADARTAETAAIAARFAEQDERQTSDEVITFMKSVLAFGSSAGQGGKDTRKNPTVKEALDRAAAQIGGRFANRPLVEAKVRRAVVDAYYNLGAMIDAVPHLERVLELHKASLGPNHETTLVDMSDLGQVYMSMRRFGDAEKLMVASLAAKRVLHGNDNRSTQKTVNNLGSLYRLQKRYAEAETLLTEGYETRRRILGPDDEDTLKSTNNLGALRMTQGRPAEAEPYFREAAEGYQRIRGTVFGTAQCWSNVADSQLAQRKFAAAEATYAIALGILDKIPAQEGAGLRKQIAGQQAKSLGLQDERVAPPPREVKPM